MMPVIGVDFDNTIVTYDDVMCRVAQERGLVAAGFGMSKRQVRDSIRLRPNGEQEWQELQAEVYGNRMDEASIADGVPVFFAQCRAHAVHVYIVSHKTENTVSGGREYNLRSAAMAWMKKNGFFDRRRFGLTKQSVFFETTRKAKIARITSLDCTHFIDDLEETFLDDSFPGKIEKILYSPAGGESCCEDVTTFTSWDAINDYFFGTAN
jgi:hypothetical protein